MLTTFKFELISRKKWALLGLQSTKLAKWEIQGLWENVQRKSIRPKCVWISPKRPIYTIAFRSFLMIFIYLTAAQDSAENFKQPIVWIFNAVAWTCSSNKYRKTFPLQALYHMPLDYANLRLPHGKRNPH